MAKKELFKSLIALTQNELPFDRIERGVQLPDSSDSIITVPCVRRAGKSSLLMLAVNKLLESKSGCCAEIPLLKTENR